MFTADSTVTLMASATEATCTASIAVIAASLQILAVACKELVEVTHSVIVISYLPLYLVRRRPLLGLYYLRLWDFDKQIWANFEATIAGAKMYGYLIAYVRQSSHQVTALKIPLERENLLPNSWPVRQTWVAELPLAVKRLYLASLMHSNFNGYYGDLRIGQAHSLHFH
jgi:hypothetical protein